MPSEQSTHYYIGLDLGQRRDHTAIAVLSAVTVILDERDPLTRTPKRRDEIRLIHLHRFALGTDYTDYPKAIRRVTNALNGAVPFTLIVDGSGPGLPVVNMLREARLPVHILTAIIAAEGSGLKPVNSVYTISRRAMLSAIRIAAETGMLKASATLPLRAQLVEELANVSIDNDNDTGHDDLVFAIALALFGARTRNPSLLRPLAA